MYKIYVNGTPVYLAHKHGSAELEPQGNGDDVLITDNTRTAFLQELVYRLNHGKPYQTVYVLAKNPKSLLKRFMKFYKLVNAGGGVVLNKNNDVLLIFRRGVWDLPKGKADGRESKRRTAVREVKEETGVKKLRVEGPVLLYPSRQTCTYHTYKENDAFMLKATYWFLMRSKSDEPLEPQESEEIFQAEWVPREEVEERLANSYPLLREVLDAALPKYSADTSIV
jgi:8-oxo-dGTP pyrophosphatase MutT (NUDIX family)